jgi:hypothetical protein
VVMDPCVRRDDTEIETPGRLIRPGVVIFALDDLPYAAL